MLDIISPAKSGQYDRFLQLKTVINYENNLFLETLNNLELAKIKFSTGKLIPTLSLMNAFLQNRKC